jgi:hypothetical protein
VLGERMWFSVANMGSVGFLIELASWMSPHWLSAGVKDSIVEVD